MSDFIAGMPASQDKTLGSSLAENSAKNALFDFYRMSACLSHELGILLPQFKMRLAVAESCTSGLLGAAVTQISGASAWFEGGVLTYSNELKHSLLGVEKKVLKTFGAVSIPTVCQMAGGVCSAAKSHIGLSVSGIAGPNGGNDEKPVGTVFIGLSLPKDFSVLRKKIKIKKGQALENGMEQNWLKSCQLMKHIYLQNESKPVLLGAFETRARHFLFEGNRESIRQSAVLMALYFAYENLID
ncbi:CinA family protein [Taurinivorans muris]|uniref:CinA family protein n=1 Tax=Taurinivorans muris TaxID=2787751 RepID=A0ABY5XZQ8_9BACT|nr:CinA family protein [Desulfovibrionaceae bacterium LT0009]